MSFEDFQAAGRRTGLDGNVTFYEKLCACYCCYCSICSCVVCSRVLVMMAFRYEHKKGCRGNGSLVHVEGQCVCGSVVDQHFFLLSLFLVLRFVRNMTENNDSLVFCSDTFPLMDVHLYHVRIDAVDDTRMGVDSITLIKPSVHGLSDLK